MGGCPTPLNVANGSAKNTTPKRVGSSPFQARACSAFVVGRVSMAAVNAFKYA
jgi:hypothetical protein